MTKLHAIQTAPLALAAALAAVLFAGPALALDAPLAADSHVSTSLPASNFGNLPTVNVGGGSTGLLRFDLGTLPEATTAAKLVKATLVLFVNRVGTDGGIEVQTVNSLWKESYVTASNQPANSGPGSSPYYGLAQAGQYMSIDVTAQVKSWITNPATNFGFALAPAVGAPTTVVFFDSKENTATGHVARLDLTLADQGPAGPQGASGANGAAGPQGPVGAQGPQGFTGAQGIPGPAGMPGGTGATGAKGATGSTGPAGANGTNGSNGATGAMGATGPVGATGATGAAGAKGATGATGPAGANGLDGATGATGATGGTGVVKSTGWGGLINLGKPIALSGGSTYRFVFVGPTTTLAFTTALQRLTAMVSGSIGVTGAPATVAVDVCLRAAGTSGDALSRTQNSQSVTLPTNVFIHVSPVTSLQPGVGSWEIGLCVASVGAHSLNLNDYVSGWAQITN